ncbi:2-oxoacid:acceptor oxidoreductase, alpha subunit [Sphaerochaeta pleomorpha str. Grapes]|uniref:2-oxoacid:acceptor oxidoreductase, alpha subunit n=1 Tax=Sphaerochaeta pleomorpha (strain ATCC BAA-1885 / DSM 22778 / Grapes) TaxID=158190 RepID=G8QQM5_SPHPG|nr:2-oxoacid:acceptor oxidoreductase subunit alpha [Sphaerochaeta pleomorpha]AEV30955.1 2-oxoacid:acceptor oxidoreductase, alpha subunit [Sphaerochaeta pleomorpha str. Grapes]
MNKGSYSVVLSGEAGQGLKTIESLFMALLQKSGYHAFLYKEFMSRVRGGNNTSEIRIASTAVSAYVNKIDLLLVFSKDGLDRLLDRIDEDTLIVGEEMYITAKKTKGKLHPIPIVEHMEKLGSQIYANNFVNGLLCDLFFCDATYAFEAIEKQFSKKGEEVVEKNRQAFQMGQEIGKTFNGTFKLPPDPAVKKRYSLSGSEAIGIGALAGGCNFIASYPMSPSTAVLVYLSKHARSHGIVVEQAEDEIAAINMGLGAWYAGARAMVTTSGGGFALMGEGVSLAGIIESPMVIHLAQRPGPATGLPTRTEQGDLNLAIYAGQGDFPRIIYAPGTFEDAIRLTHRAFEMADAFQVPVFVLTDQYFLDSEGQLDPIDFSTLTVTNNIVKTEKEYLRYELTPSGLSPRGIPSFGEGLVCVDSDEHTEEGRITESAAVRVSMVDKRLRKIEGYKEVEVEIVGEKDYETLVVLWGSPYGAVKEAVERIGDKTIAIAYFKQVFPLPLATRAILSKAKRRILVENNATGQLGELIARDLQLTFDAKILKYNGFAFSVEELATQIKGALK